MRNFPEYTNWSAAMSRTGNPNDSRYEDYMGRGITMCDRWRLGEGGKSGFECFYEDMGPKPSKGHSLHRVDNDGNYEPGNCVWATAVQQANCKTSNRYLQVDGRKMTATQWANEVGVPVNRILDRIKLGWSLEKAIFAPKQK